MFQWSDESLRFLKDASEYTRYHDALALRIATRLPPGPRLCDAGCGLGYLSLALAPSCAELTAVDTDARALAVLEANRRRLGITNVSAVLADIHGMRPDPPYDAMVFCFFGGVMETLGIVKRQCRGKAFLIKKNYGAHRFSPGHTPLTRHTYTDTAEELKRLGVPFDKETFALEMGQPFRSIEDAAAFIRLHTRQGEPPLSRDALYARLVPGDSPEFPYYLPAKSALGMITLHAADIPEAALAAHIG